MTHLLLEYLGFRATDEGRDYLLRTRFDEEVHGYTVHIGREAFASGRARFQDGPEISYVKVRDELAAHENGPVGDVFTINDAELATYRETHTRPTRRGFSTPDPPRSAGEASSATAATRTASAATSHRPAAGRASTNAQEENR